MGEFLKSAWGGIAPESCHVWAFVVDGTDEASDVVLMDGAQSPQPDWTPTAFPGRWVMVPGTTAAERRWWISRAVVHHIDSPAGRVHYWDGHPCWSRVVDTLKGRAVYPIADSRWEAKRWLDEGRGLMPLA